MEPSQTKTNLLAIPIAIVIAGAIIGGALLAALRQPGSPTAAITQQPKARVVDVSKVKTEDEPFIGKQNAPVTIAYWYDYQCPFCQRNEEDTMPQIVKDYVDTGRVKVVFKDFQFLGPDSQTLGKYSRAVWETAPAKFYQWHKAIYDNQGAENTGWATEAKILSITTSVLGVGDTGKVAALVNAKGDEYQREMDVDKEEGATMGINGTPGTIIGKQLIEGAQPYAQFKAAIETALTGK